MVIRADDHEGGREERYACRHFRPQRALIAGWRNWVRIRATGFRSYLRQLISGPRFPLRWCMFAFLIVRMRDLASGLPAAMVLES